MSIIVSLIYASFDYIYSLILLLLIVICSIIYYFKFIGINRKLAPVDNDDQIDIQKQIDDSDDCDIELPNYPRIAYRHVQLPLDEMLRRSQLFYESMKVRRSVRDFSSRDVPIKLIQNIVKVAGTSPSGANLQPWTFAVVGDRHLKSEIRRLVECEEELNYARRMSRQWVADVSQLSINWIKPYLTDAPYLLVVFKQTSQTRPDGSRQVTYYNEMSTCIAVGLLLAAIQIAGLVTVTTTPLNAGASIHTLLQRPNNEKAILLLPIGYPADDATIPDIKRKPLEDILKLY